MKTKKSIAVFISLIVLLTGILLASPKKTEYIIVIEIKQTHFTLGLLEHVKDKMNKITIEIPTTKEYYNKIRIGDKLNDKFRTGSLIVRGSFGKWKITIVDKKIIGG